MPTYEWTCKNGHHFERILPIADYKSEQICECGAIGRRIITLPPMVKMSRDVCYDSPIDGTPITSMKKRKWDLARSGCQPYDPEMKTDADNFRKDKQAALERQVDETVERAYEAMPSRKKEALANELLGGADATPTRHNVPAKPIVTEIKSHG